MNKAQKGSRHHDKLPDKPEELRVQELLAENEVLKQKLSELEGAKSQQKPENCGRYRMLFEAGNDMVFVHSYKDGKVDTFNEVNEKACQVLGYSKEEFKKLTPQDITVEEVSDQLSADPLWKGEKLLYEKTLISKTGQYIPVEINTQLIPVQGATTALSIVRDITERKKANDALKTSEQKLRMLINHSPIGVSTVDLQGRFMEVNPALCKILGYAEEELLGRHYNQFSHPDDHEKNLELSQKLLHGEISSFTMEKRYIRKNGKIVDILMRAQLIRDEKGNPISQASVIEDVTKRKKDERIQRVLFNIAEAALMSETVVGLIGKVQVELAKIFDTRNLFLAFYNPHNDTFSSPYVNDDQDDMNTWPAEKSLSGLVVKTKKSLRVKHDALLKMLNSGTLEPIITLPQVWMGAPLTVSGKTNAVLAVQHYTDAHAYSKRDLEILEFVGTQISRSLERQKANEELRAALNKANESDRLKSAFLATMSHELRTPLNAIIGFSEFLFEELSSADVQKFGEIIHSSGLHLLSIVNDLFDITLIESGETTLRKTPTNLNLLLHEVKDIVDKKRERENKLHIEFNLHFPKNGKTPDVVIDSDKVKQILINLLNNAFKFTEKGAVDAGVGIAVREGQCYVDFYVTDTGIGIGNDDQEIIFDLFRQVEDSNIRKYSGTGIGLAVARRLTEIMEGRITVNSEPGKGSTFYVSIPFDPSPLHPVESDQQKHVAEKMSTKACVLITEDDEPSFYLMKVLLEESGMQVIWAKNAEEAVRQCASNEAISLVLMDIHLPGMDGYQATQEIKKIRPQLPVIAQTAYAAIGDREKALRAGCTDYIAKPIRTQELLQKIRRLFESKA